MGESKLKLVETAQNYLKTNDFDEIWCVFDMDIKADEKRCIPDFDSAVKKAKELGMKVAYSNDAFELWFYLHYFYTDTENHRTFYYEKLSQIWGLNYEKEGKKRKFCSELYQKLQNDPKASQTQALTRARKLYIERKDLEYHKQNPMTTVFELVELLNENMR